MIQKPLALVQLGYLCVSNYSYQDKIFGSGFWVLGSGGFWVPGSGF